MGVCVLICYRTLLGPIIPFDLFYYMTLDEKLFMCMQSLLSCSVEVPKLGTYVGTCRFGSNSGVIGGYLSSVRDRQGQVSFDLHSPYLKH
jgi:hypothetical protein